MFQRGENDQELKGLTIYDIIHFKSQIKKIIILAILCVLSSFNLNVIILILFKIIKEFLHILIIILLLKIMIGVIAGYISDIIGRKPIIMFDGLIGSISYYIYTENILFLFNDLINLLSGNKCCFIYLYSWNIPTPIRYTFSDYNAYGKNFEEKDEEYEFDNNFDYLSQREKSKTIKSDNKQNTEKLPTEEHS